MKLNQDFKDETRMAFKQGDYVGRRVGIRIFIIIVILMIFTSIAGVSYKKWKTEQDRKIFKESTTYNEGVAAFLVKSYKEYNDSDSDVEKNAIMDYVIISYPNLDLDNIDNQLIKQFYIKCQQ